MLLDRLRGKQEAMGLSDSEFATELKVPRSTWQLTRSGKVPMGPRLAQAARLAFPDLTDEALLFLLSYARPLADCARRRNRKENSER